MIEMIETFIATEGEKRGLEYRFEQLERFPETGNDPALTEAMLPLLDEWGFDWQIQEEANRGSEDFGHLAKLVPSVYFIVGLGEDHPPVHSIDFEFEDKAIPYGLKLLENIARHGVDTD